MSISTKLNCAKQTDGNDMDVSGFHRENEGENRIESPHVHLLSKHLNIIHKGNVSRILCIISKLQEVHKYILTYYRECVSTGAAGVRTRRSLGHHLLHPLILRLLVLCAPAVLRPNYLQDAPAPADPNS